MEEAEVTNLLREVEEWRLQMFRGRWKRRRLQMFRGRWKRRRLQMFRDKGGNVERLMVLSDLFSDWLKFFAYNNTYCIVIAAVTAWLFGDFMNQFGLKRLFLVRLIQRIQILKSDTR